MAIQDSVLNIVIKAKNQASGVLNDFNNQAGKSISAGKAAAFAVQGLGIAAGGLAVKMGVDAVKAAINFETKMSEVRKTTGFSADETKKFGNSLLEMSKSLPVATDDLADIAAVAGQLGIQGTKNIQDFTEIIAKATIALPEFAGGAEEIALSVAKAQNVFKFATKESENYLSVLNELSNTTAANAVEISRFVDNFGGAATTMGITAGEAAALGAAFVSMGEDGSDAGTRSSSAIIFMQKHLDDAAEMAGMSTAKFKKYLDTNAIAAIQDVVKGLQKIPSATDRNIAAMEIFGQIGGKVMSKMGGNIDIVNTSLNTQKDAWNTNISLQKEFDVASETTAKQWQQFNNNVNVILIELGNAILPKVNAGLKGMIELLTASNVNKQVESINQLSEATNKLVEERKKNKAEGKSTERLDQMIKSNMEVQTQLSKPSGIFKSILGYADGGIVPGTKGAAQIAVVHGGETITPPDKTGTTIIFDLHNATITDKNLIDRIKNEINKSFNIKKFK